MSVLDLIVLKLTLYGLYVPRTNGRPNVVILYILFALKNVLMYLIAYNVCM